MAAKKQTAKQRSKNASLLQSDGRSLPDFEKIKFSNKDYNNCLIDALNYSAYVFDNSDKKGFVRDYIEVNNMKTKINHIPDYEFYSIGTLYWLLSNDCDLKSVDDIHKRLFALSEKHKTAKKQQKKIKIVTQDAPTIKTNYLIGELEGVIDDVMMRIEAQQPLELFKSIQGTFHVDKIKTHFEQQVESLTREDYPCDFTYKVVSGTIKIILNDLQTYVDEVRPKKRATVTKMRKPKKIIPTRVVKNLNMLKEADIDSKTYKAMPTAKLVTADTIWVYNTKNRMLRQYVAQDRVGLMCKGKSIVNYDVDKSFEKMLRKPSEMIDELMKLGKVDQRSYLDKLSTMKKPVKARITDDCILIKVY